jgi:DNA-binding YbaB/EbfC family protein
MNIAKLAKQAAELQSKMKKMQQELAVAEFEFSSGGGAVTAKTNGENRLLSIKIQPKVLQSGDAEMLEDLVLTAVNGAIQAGQNAAQEKMSALSGGMGLPGGFPGF